MTSTLTRSSMLSLVCFSLITAATLAQAQPPPPPAPPTTVTIAKHRTAPAPHSMLMRMNSGDEGGMGIVPPGTWWRTPSTIQTLTLTTDQQKRMDEIFRQNRIQLVDLHAALEKEQINLEPLLNANPPDTNKALAQISHIADLRADLEKANAKMLLALRSTLTVDQWSKLQAQRHDMPHMMMNPMEMHMERMPGMGGHSSTHTGNTTTICTQVAGQTEPKCTTTSNGTPGGGPTGGGFMMAAPRGPNPPQQFTVEIPD